MKTEKQIREKLKRLQKEFDSYNGKIWEVKQGFCDQISILKWVLKP